MVLTADLAFSIGLFAGWLALVVWLVWPDPHCACCAKRLAEQIAAQFLLAMIAGQSQQTPRENGNADKPTTH